MSVRIGWMCPKTLIQKENIAFMSYDFTFSFPYQCLMLNYYCHYYLDVQPLPYVYDYPSVVFGVKQGQFSRERPA